MLFETLRKMNETRPFKLLFSFEGPCFVPKGNRRELVEPQWEVKAALDSVAAEGLLDFLDSPPTLRNVKCRQWDFYLPY